MALARARSCRTRVLRQILRGRIVTIAVFAFVRVDSDAAGHGPVLISGRLSRAGKSWRDRGIGGAQRWCIPMPVGHLNRQRRGDR